MASGTVESLCQQARQAVAERDYNQARQLYLQALGFDPDDADVHYGLATVYFLLSDLESAAHHFKQVNRIDPHRAGRATGERHTAETLEPAVDRIYERRELVRCASC